MKAEDHAYDRWATLQSKWVIGAFSLTCVFVAVFKEWGFGIWWIAVWAVGIFVSSLAAAPFVIGEWLARKKSMTWLALLLGITYTWGTFPASYYALKYLADWIYN